RVVRVGCVFGRDELGRHGFAHGVVGGAHVAGHLDVRDIERTPDFIEAASHAVLRQFVLDLDPGNVEDVADGVLVFVGVEAAQSGAAALDNGGLFVIGER